MNRTIDTGRGRRATLTGLAALGVARVAGLGSSVGLALALTPAVPALADSGYPSRTVTIIVPFPPGGGTDGGARLIAQKLAERWKQQVVVDNKGGAGGIVGVELAAKARPDGYTLLVGNIGTQAINESLYRKLGYTQADFEPISMIADLPIALLASPSLKANTVGELVALARAEPGKVIAASSGVGNSTHLALEIFQSAAGVRFLHVPYKGGSQAMADVMAGHAGFQFNSILGSTGQIQSGKVKALAVASPARSPSLPDVPTMAEAGVADAEMASWVGILAPRGTPAAIVEKISADVRDVVAREDFRATLVEQGATARASTPAEFRATIARDSQRFAALIRRLGIQLE